MIDPEKTSFRDLDGNAVLPAPSSPLELWYESVRDTEIADMYVGDLARACRQGLFLAEILPTCLVVLRHDPLAGEMLEGELLLACIGAPETVLNPDIIRVLCKVSRSAIRLQSIEGYHVPDPDHLLPCINAYLEKFCL